MFGKCRLTLVSRRELLPFVWSVISLSRARPKFVIYVLLMDRWHRFRSTIVSSRIGCRWSHLNDRTLWRTHRCCSSSTLFSVSLVVIVCVGRSFSWRSTCLGRGFRSQTFNHPPRYTHTGDVTLTGYKTFMILKRSSTVKIFHDLLVSRQNVTAVKPSPKPKHHQFYWRLVLQLPPKVPKTERFSALSTISP